MTAAFERVGPTLIEPALGLLRAQFLEHQIELPDSALATAVRELVATPSRGALLLARTPEPVGIAALAFTWTLEHGGLVAWLDELYVLPRARAQGVGSALLEHALAFARDEGCRTMELEIDAEHARAASLYARHGFRSLPRSRWARGLEGTRASSRSSPKR